MRYARVSPPTDLNLISAAHAELDGRTVTRTVEHTDERPVVRAYLGSYGILGAYVSVDVPGRHVLEPGGPVRGMLCPSRRVQGLRVRRLHR